MKNTNNSIFVFEYEGTYFAMRATSFSASRIEPNLVFSVMQENKNEPLAKLEERARNEARSRNIAHVINLDVNQD